jgi:hypothetical protein
MSMTKYGAKPEETSKTASGAPGSKVVVGIDWALDRVKDDTDRLVFVARKVEEPAKEPK